MNVIGLSYTISLFDVAHLYVCGGAWHLLYTQITSEEFVKMTVLLVHMQLDNLTANQAYKTRLNAVVAISTRVDP